MVEFNQFLNNLSQTCTKNVLIREDGKKLNFFHRFIDLFRQKHSEDHFRTVCRTLHEVCKSGQMNAIKENQGMDILVRLKQLQKVIDPGGALRKDCDQYITEIEKMMLDKSRVTALTTAILLDLKTSSEKFLEVRVDRDIKHLEMLVDFHRMDQRVVHLILEKWKKVVKQTPTSRSYDTFIEKLLSNQERKNNAVENVADYRYLIKLKFEAAFKGRNFQEISSHIHSMKELMEKNAENEAFIQVCLQTVNDFLSEVVFSKKDVTALPEISKNDLLAFKEIFPLVNTFFPVIQDPKLALDLKIKCANLPCPSPRTSFPRIFLSEKEQVDILIESLQIQEDAKVDQVCTFLVTGNPPVKHIAQLAKLVGIESHLSPQNCEKLRATLKNRLQDDAPVDWNDFRNVKKALETCFIVDPGSTDLIVSLNRAAKAKKFFIDQVGLDEEMIMIPRWYHATSRMSAVDILNSGKIEVRHSKTFRGAWISSQRESGFGDYALSLGGRVEAIDPNVFIGFTFTDKRWRGLQKMIQLKSDLIMVGVPDQVDKMAKKADKVKMVRLLKAQGYPNPKALSVSQLDFIQRKVMEILGTPNLVDQWWGSGRAYSDHQLKLQDQLSVVPFEDELFAVQKSPQDQLKIGKIVQSIALPCYKTEMPPYPSYQSNLMNTRVELGAISENRHKQHLEAVRKKEVPARGHHGSMHSARVTLWTQVLAKAYVRMGRREIDNPILLATAGAFHDSARESEGIDYWDNESAILLETFLKRTNVAPHDIKTFVQCIKEKDPRDNAFTTDVQRIVHDADCLEIIRVVGKFNFRANNLCFYGFDKKQKKFCEQLINEVADFIQLTEKQQIRTYLEHQSDDFYGDLVRYLFTLKTKGQPRFPLLTELVREDMQELLKVNRKPQMEALQQL